MTHKTFIKKYLKHNKWYIENNTLYILCGLNFMGSNIKILPEKLSINRYLDLYGTNITSLPNNLYITGWLDLRKTKIESLPETLSVSCNIHVDNEILMSEKTQLNLIQQNKSHFKIIKNPTSKTKTLHKLLWEI